MDSLTIVATVVLCALASGWDLRTHRIPNVLTMGAMVAGILAHAASGGLSGLVSSLAGLGVGLILFFPFFALGGLGAGDVKLLGAIGAWLGAGRVFWAALYSSIAGGVVALLLVAATGRFRDTAAGLFVMFSHWQASGPSSVPGMTLKESSGPRLAYAIPITLGTMVTLWLD